MESNPNNTVQEPVVLSMDEERHKKEASSAMVLGIVGDVLVWYPILGIAGLVLSIIALVKANQNRDFAMRAGIREHGANIAGKWCGIGGIIVGAFLLVVYLNQCGKTEVIANSNVVLHVIFCQNGTD